METSKRIRTIKNQVLVSRVVMYIWDPTKFSKFLVFPIETPKQAFDGSLYSTILPAGLCEVNGSRQESFNTTEFTATKEFICDWDKRFDYIVVLRETVYNFEDFTYENVTHRRQISKDPPVFEEYKVSHIFNSYWNYYLPAFAQSIQVAPLGAEGGPGYEATPMVNASGELYYATNIQKYTKAKITVSYKGLSRLSSATLDQTITPQLQMRKLPPFGFTWLSDGTQVLDKEAPGKHEMKLKIQRTLSNIRCVPDVFFDLAGSVNDALVVDWLTGMTFAAGTLLYMPTNMTKRMTSAIGDDDRLWNFSFELNWNPIGWNRFQRPHGIDTMMFNGVPVPLYPYANFELLGLNEQLGAVSEDDQVEGVSSSPFTSLYENYYVLLQRKDGSVDCIQVPPYGDALLVESNVGHH